MLYYYIMIDPDKSHRCKVGITKDPKQRLRAYRTSNPAVYFSVVYKIPCSLHERKLLDLLRDVCVVRSEYIHYDPSLVQNIVEGYFTDNGISY